jgi:hypothetical protein
MSLWASQRKSYYVGGFLLVVIIIAGIFLYSYFNKKPTCFDLKQNGNETGIDCGGSCVLLCKADYVEPVVLWSRFQKVTDGVYNLLAYVENPNLDAGAQHMPYVFQVYDKEGVLLTEIRDETFIPANRAVAIFEGAVRTGLREPSKVTFSFNNSALWEKVISKELGLITTDKKALNTDTSPRIEANLRNTTLKTISNIEVVVIAYDVHDNSVAFSRTVVDSVLPDANRRLVYTWPTPFSAPVVRIEIITRILGQL